MARRKQLPKRILWTRATIPLFHFPTPKRPLTYTFADGGLFQVRQREWTQFFGYIYYVNILKTSLSTGRLERRVYTERELMLFMGMLHMTGKAA